MGFFNDAKTRANKNNKKLEEAAENQELFLKEGGTGFETPSLFDEDDEDLDRDQRLAKQEFEDLFT